MIKTIKKKLIYLTHHLSKAKNPWSSVASVCCLLIFFCFAQHAAAQSILKDSTQLSVLLREVVVTGTGTEHYLKDAPVQTEVISGAALEQYQARSIDDLLSGLSPSLSFHDGDMGSHIQLNGLNNDYILIMINGKRMNGDVGGQNDLNQLNPANIERIEIVKGAASSLYGSDAIAGVINIITKRSRSKMDLTSTTRVGSHGDVRESASFGLTLGKVKLVTAVNFRHTDGWRNTDQEWDQNQLKTGSTRLTVNRATNYTVSEDLTWEASRRLTLTAGVNIYQRWVMRSHGPYKYLANDFYYNNHRLTAGAKYQLRGRNYLSADVTYGRYGYFYDYKRNEYTDYYIDNDRHQHVTFYAGQRIKQSIQQQLQAQVKGVFYMGDDHTLHVGAEYLLDRLESPHRIESGKASVYSLAAYAQEEWTASPSLTLTAGLRATVHKETGANLTPKLSALWKASPRVNLRATYAMGYKSPTIKELYYNYSGVIGGGSLTAYHGNTDLKAQTSQYASLGVEYSGEKLQASLTGYANFIRDMIELVEIAVTPDEQMQEIQRSKEYRNLTKARIWGIDATINWHPLPSLSLGGGYSFTDPKAQYAEEGDSQMDYLYIDATSCHNASWHASWKHAWKAYQLGIGIYGRYQSTRHYVEDNNAGAFQTWRINTAHTLPRLGRCSLTINVGVDNLFNYVDRTPFGRNRATTTPGRTLYASVVVKLK